MQKGYVVTELESLAVAWAMEKFHHFLYGNEFTLETDQKPLEVILSKKSQSSNTETTENLNKNIPIPFQSKVHPRPKLTMLQIACPD